MTATPPTVPGPTDLRPLTALRFVAAAWVVIYAFWPDLNVSVLPHAVAKGYLGVEVFFVLSGFILCHVYLEAFGTKRSDYRGFLWARLARVYPLHLFTLFGVIALGLAATVAGLSMNANVLNWASLPANLAMVHAWGLAPEAAFNHPSWSISAEWFAYLAFPVFAAAAWRIRNRPWIALAVTAAFIPVLYLAFEVLAGFPLTQATIRWGALRIVPCFAYGCALYLLYRHSPVTRPGPLAAVSALALAAAAALSAPDALIVVLAGAMILGLAGIPNGRAGIMASGPAVYLGEISYSVYMVCIPVKLVAVNLAARLTGAGDEGLSWPVWLALVLMVPVIAAGTYHLVEKPARIWLRAHRPGRKGRGLPTANSPAEGFQAPKTIV
jgi:peptidoglycan/LPS O-acetylase OafA/YrhL